MTRELEALAGRFAFNRKVLASAVAGFSGGDWDRRPSESGGNSAHWILGHLAVSRRYLVRKLGGELSEEAWEEEFGMNAEPGDTSGYPSPETLLEDVAAVGESVAALLAGLSPERADAEWGSSFPDGSHTLSGGTYFLHFHESYHVGQLGLLRRTLGKPGFA